MSEAHTTIAYLGEKVQGGQMDVKDLAPALLAVGKLCERAHKLINNSDEGVSVLVKKVKAGSFEIDLSVVSSFLGQTETLFEEDVCKTAEELLSFIGLSEETVDKASLGVGGVLPVIGIYKSIKGRKIKEIIHEGKDVKVKTFKGDEVTTTEEAWKLYQDSIMRHNMAEIVSPLEQEGIDSLEVRKDGESIESIDENHLSYFTNILKEEETINEERSETMLRVDSLHITDVGRKWRFSTIGKYSINITASIIDKDYLEKVKRGEVTFKNGVCIKGILITKHIVQDGREKTEYEIDNIQHNIQHDVQHSLW